MKIRRAIPAARISPNDLWAWEVDPVQNLFLHANGLRVQFVRCRGNDDWHPVPLLPLPPDLLALDFTRYVVAAVRLFAAGQAVTYAGSQLLPRQRTQKSEISRAVPLTPAEREITQSPLRIDDKTRRQPARLPAVGNGTVVVHVTV